MNKRGRPPHPDVLTPREWDVLTLVREGLTNPQIAERLGITMDAVKYHVSEILSKLALSSREEAGAWQPEPAERVVLRPSWASALAALFRSWPLIARIGGATVVAAAVAGIGALAYGVSRSGGDDDGAQLTATAAITPTASAGATELTVLPSILLPPNLAIVIEVGCCETQLTGLIRATAEGGTGQRDVLFSAGTHSFTTTDGSTDFRDEYFASGVTLPTPNPQAPFKAPAEDQPYVATYGVSADARAMVVGLCIRGSCEGVNAAPNDQGITQLYRSLDGGDTWSELVQLGPYVNVAGVTSDGSVLIADATVSLKDETYRWEPGGESVTPPVDVTTPPTVLADGRVIWPGPLGVLYFQDGSVIASGLGSPPFGDILDLGDGRFAAQNGDAITIVRNGAAAESYGVPGLFNVGAYLGDDVFVALITVGTDEVPALVDINHRTVEPINSPFLDVGFDSPQFLILAGAYQIHTPPTGL